MTTLVDLAHATYPAQHRCKLCDVALRYVNHRWVDGAASAWCWQGLTEHVPREVKAAAPVVTPSPLLRWWR